jgi:hypothetical protein
MNSIKNLANTVSRTIRVLILVLLIVYVVINNIGSYGNVLLAFEALAPLALIVTGILFLELKDKEFAAHTALLVGFFLSAGTNFINSLLSFRFSPFGFANPPTFDSFVEIFGFIYLLLMAISLYFTFKSTTKNKRKDLVITAIIAFIFFYLRSGLFIAISKLLLPVISLLFGLPLATILFLAAGVIDVPFDFLDTILNTNLLSIELSYYLFTAFAFYLIFGAVKGILAELTNKDKKK